MNAKFAAGTWGATLLALVALTVGPVALAAEASKTPNAAKEDAQLQKALEQEQRELDQQQRATEQELQQQLEVARTKLDAAAREVAELSMSISDDVMPNVRWFSGPGQKAMLGINLGTPSKKERDDGVEVVSVSPGGAAAEAGLKARDVLVDINGKSLQRDSDGAPREKLLRQMREIDAGEKVTVGYRRDGKVAKATLTAKPVGDRFVFRGARPAMPAMPAVPVPHVDRPSVFEFGPNMAFFRAAGVFGSVELVPLTPKLGQYFGTDKGLLVVRATEDSRLKLEDGDVIVDIDGRTPSSPSHALRILSSYQAGEKLKLNVMRAKKMVSFEITIPEDTWEKRLDGAHFRHDADTDVDVLLTPRGVAVPAPPRAATFDVRIEDEPI